MPARLVVAALASVSLLCCGPQNVVEDTGGLPADEGVTRDEVKRSGGNQPAPIAMQVREAAAQPGPFATSFSINATYDLFYAFDMPSTKSGSHTARFEFYTPGNTVYAVTAVAFSAGNAASGEQVQADVISGGYRVWTSMPLAGTMVQQLAITGKWTVKVFLDNAKVASSVYTLTP